MNALILWLAQGFGAGRIPGAPGTWGTLVGFAWFLALLSLRNPYAFMAGMGASFVASVWLCGSAEKLLRQTDPASVVLDEIVAVPLCFAGWLALVWHQTGQLPDAKFFFRGAHLPLTLGVLVAFRIFDIWKPWPIRQSQWLLGGLGVTIDDLLAAVYVSLLFLAGSALKTSFWP